MKKRIRAYSKAYDLWLGGACLSLAAALYAEPGKRDKEYLKRRRYFEALLPERKIQTP